MEWQLPSISEAIALSLWHLGAASGRVPLAKPQVGNLFRRVIRGSCFLPLNLGIMFYIHSLEWLESRGEHMSIDVITQTVLTAAALELVYKAVKDFIQETLPELAEQYEKELNDELSKLKPGDRFIDEIDVANVDNDFWYPVLRFSDIEVSAVPGMKIDLIRGTLRVRKKINLTDSSTPPIIIDSIRAYAFQVSLERPDYGLSIGGGRDDDLNFSQYLVNVRWDAIPLNVEGYYAEAKSGGFIVSVETNLPFPVPLATSGLGLCGIGLTYSERFAPKLFENAKDDPIDQMRRASAQDFVNWARKNKLEQWRPAPANVNIRIFGLKTDVGDLATSGCIVRFDDCGFTYVTSGPIIVFGGKFIALRSLNLGESIAAVDIPSESLFLSNSVTVPIRDLLTISGTSEYSASLKDQNKTWVALGGYSMDGARVNLLKILELWGGARLVPLQGFAMRAGGRVRCGGKILGFGGGISLSVEVMGAIGWNPIQVEGQFSLDGYAWIELFGKEIGVGLRSDLKLRFPKPAELKLRATVSIKIWFARISKTVTIFNLEDKDVQQALEALAIYTGSPIAFWVLANGALGAINDKTNNPLNEVPPDVAFDIPFQQIPSGVSNAVNAAAGDGIYLEGGINVVHKVTQIRVEQINELTGEVKEIPVSSAWLAMADGASHRRSARLAVPCANPFAWLNAYDYATPGSTELSRDAVFQTFGSGPNEEIGNGSGGVAVLRFGRLMLSAPRLFLRNFYRVKPYDRAIFVQRITLSVEKEPDRTGSLLAVHSFDLRFVGLSPPRVGGPEFSGIVTTRVRELNCGYSEWSVIILRTDTTAKAPLECFARDEQPFTLVAVGYEIDWTDDFAGGDETIFQPGVYELTLKGTSDASWAGHPAETTNWIGLKERFRVIAPKNLRPYLRYATNGDERLFSRPKPSWNPNPYGLGFGHYKDHVGVSRSKVGYLSKIFPSVYVSTRDNEALVEAKVVECSEHTIAGSNLTKEWEAAYGGTLVTEEEFVYGLPRIAGEYRFSVFAVRSLGCTPEKIDEWAYRVSRYHRPSEHLLPALGGIVRAYGSFGTKFVKPAPLPINQSELSSLVDAKLAPGWGLPGWIQRETGIGLNSGLTFLRMAEWSGLFKAPPPFHSEKIVVPPDDSELCLLCDTDPRPAGLILRTPEPVDWRRAKIAVYRRGINGWDQRFDAKLTPSADGTSCMISLLAEGVAVRVPAGDLAIDVTFLYVCDGLPSLIDGADRSLKSDKLLFAFSQPLGLTWPAPS